MTITQLDKDSILEGSVKSLPNVVEGKAEELKDAMVRPSENIVTATNKAIEQIDIALNGCVLRSDVKANMEGMADDAAHIVLSRKATKTAIDTAVDTAVTKKTAVKVNNKLVEELAFNSDPQEQIDNLAFKLLYDSKSTDAALKCGLASGMVSGVNYAHNSALRKAILGDKWLEKRALLIHGYVNNTSKFAQVVFSYKVNESDGSTGSFIMSNTLYSDVYIGSVRFMDMDDFFGWKVKTLAGDNENGGIIEKIYLISKI